MPTRVRVFPEPEPQTVYLNFNKITKFAKSKQGIEGARRYEENLKEIDYWHPESTKDIKDSAVKALYRYISAVFTKLNAYEQSALANQLTHNVHTKINEKISALDGLDFYNAGKAGDKVLECAMERDNHLTIIEGIKKEAERRGQKNLNKTQLQDIEIELKRARAWDDKRIEYVQARIEANKKNAEIAAKKSPEALDAFNYLYQPPSAMTTKK